MRRTFAALVYLAAAAASAGNRTLENRRLAILHNMIAAKCQIVGVSVGTWDDKTTWTVFYEGKPERKALGDSCAEPVVSAFDVKSLPQQ